MGLANIVYANNSGRRTVLPGELPEIALNKPDHRPRSRDLPDHAVQENILE